MTTIIVVFCKFILIKKEALETVEQFIEQQRSLGSYSFSREMLSDAFDRSDKALKQALFRLKTKGKIAHIKSGFYVIITPEFSNAGMVPTHLFIDDLMKHLGKRYYVGLFSAAALQGASHQAVMEYYVVTDYPPVRSVKNEKVKLNFFTKKEWEQGFIFQRKTDAGYINVSYPELTALDLLSYGNFSINRVATVLEELVESFDAKRLKHTIKHASTASIQRLGYLLDIVSFENSFGKVLQQELSKRKVFPVALSKHASKKGAINSNWNVIENITVESDL